MHPWHYLQGMPRGGHSGLVGERTQRSYPEGPLDQLEWRNGQVPAHAVVGQRTQGATVGLAISQFYHLRHPEGPLLPEVENSALIGQSGRKSDT